MAEEEWKRPPLCGREWAEAPSFPAAGGAADHVCNLYCRDGFHTDLWYTPSWETRASLLESIPDQFVPTLGCRARLVDARPATEAPAPDFPDAGECRTPWLFTWDLLDGDETSDLPYPAYPAWGPGQAAR